MVVFNVLFLRLFPFFVELVLARQRGGLEDPLLALTFLADIEVFELLVLVSFRDHNRI